ncbi:alpha/beta hydrolase [Roseomonas hellenica]|uniref:Alpha/beta hydrolase n=1 Tax=Plastoroseomonas hellenica TaxID=2687306 RepID=A0ABS5F154_9PROT|nr:alpha/beta hydrolase [Plastoroseomonas hellenica]MBR0666282.1 alpha/beta hydrolase [Plastoroseomonas hellenica]
MTSRPSPWASLSPEEHEFHFNPQRAFPDFATHKLRRAPANEGALAGLRREAELAYGPTPRHRLDIYPAARPGAPVHVFFHGGYWRANDKNGFAYIAAALVRHGITVAIPNYELCPDATLDGTVASARAAIAWLARHAGDHGGDPTAISLSGHSAGAHLCAAALATDWAAEGLDPAFLRGAVMTSGIYDPLPAMLTTVNQDLRLTPEIAARNDFEHRPPVSRARAHLFVGGREPWHWIDQSFRYSHHLRRHGGDPEVHVLPGHDHFDILDQYMAEESPILRAVLRAAGAGGA